MITKVSAHKGRQREVQGNRDPVSEFLASLCPLVEASSLAPRRKTCWVTPSRESSPGSPSPHLLKGDNKNTYLFGVL